MIYKRVRGWTLGRSLPVLNFVNNPLPPPGCSIHQNDKIQGIKIKNEEVKLSLFADDVTCFLRNKSSYQHLSSSLEHFSKFSGLTLNKEKTEFFRLGVHNLCESFPHEFKLSIQILGVHFDYDEFSRKKASDPKIY